MHSTAAKFQHPPIPDYTTCQRIQLPGSQRSTGIFSHLDDASFFSQQAKAAEALGMGSSASVDVKPAMHISMSGPSAFKNDMTGLVSTTSLQPATYTPPSVRPPDPMSMTFLGHSAAPPYGIPQCIEQYTTPVHQFAQYHPNPYHIAPVGPPHHALATGHAVLSAQRNPPVPVSTTTLDPPTGSLDPDTDPRSLEHFAEHFKQRRIKLGVTQSDVGKALANLKLPGVGSLSQSTICRFESLTLSHNNMITLKPILERWLLDAEKNYPRNLDDKKRKRTSIPNAEKRNLEAYFRMCSRPSSDKLASIAAQLDLKRSVVRVWFCNRRQKEKRLRSKHASNMFC